MTNPHSIIWHSELNPSSSVAYAMWPRYPIKPTLRLNIFHQIVHELRQVTISELFKSIIWPIRSHTHTQRGLLHHLFGRKKREMKWLHFKSWCHEVFVHFPPTGYFPNKRLTSMSFSIAGFYKQIYILCTLLCTLVHMSHPAANPN